MKKNTKNSAKATSLPTAKEINNFLDAQIRGHYDADFELVSENDEPSYEEFLHSLFSEEYLLVLQETYRKCLQNVANFYSTQPLQCVETGSDEARMHDMERENHEVYLQSALKTARSNLVSFCEIELQKIQESGARFREHESWQQLQLLSC